MEKINKNIKKNNKNAQNFKKNNKFLDENKNFSEKNKINFKKNLGQNFLFDINLLNAIVKDGLVESGDTVLEIGAGAGTLTEALAKVAKKVISFEIDNSLVPILQNRLEKYTNVEFHFQDFMQAEIESLFEGQARVVANIPYYITTPIVFKLVEKIERFKSILVLVQKEVAERFASGCNSKDYGVTSVILQSMFDVSVPRIVKKECFTPSPKIDSALCLLVPHKKYNISNFEGFKKFIHLAFSMRRKTLVNNFKSAHEKEAVTTSLSSLGYNEKVRPEQICVEDYVKLFKLLN